MTAPAQPAAVPPSRDTGLPHGTRVRDDLEGPPGVPATPPRRAALGVALFLLGVALVDRAGGAVLRRGFDTVTTGEGAGQVNAALRHPDVDVVFFGSSRARQHFAPRVLREATGLSAYNAGANGQTLPYARMLQAALLARGRHARAHVLHLDPIDLFDARPERARFLMPLADEVPAIDALLGDGDPWYRLKRVSRLYSYNSLALPILSNLGKSARRDADGFVPHAARAGVAELREAGEGDGAPPERIRDDLERLLGEFVEAARGAGAVPLLVTAPLAPSVARSARRERAERLIFDFARARGITYLPLDARTVPALGDPHLFADPLHLTEQGAVALTQALAPALTAAVTRGAAR